MRSRNANLSICVTSYNSASTLEHTLESISHFLKGHCCITVEVILADQSGDDSCADVFHRWEALHGLNVASQYVKSNCTSAGQNKNLAISSARGDFILVLDSDDLLDVNSVFNMYSTLESNENINAVFFQSAYYFSYSISRIWGRESLEEAFKAKKEAFQPNFMFRRSFFLDNDIWYPDTLHLDSQLFFLNYFKKEPVVNFVEKTYYYHRRFSSKASYFEREGSGELDSDFVKSVCSYLKIKNVQDLGILNKGITFTQVEFIRLLAEYIVFATISVDRFNGSSNRKPSFWLKIRRIQALEPLVFYVWKVFNFVRDFWRNRNDGA